MSIPISFYVEGQGIYHFQSYVVLKNKNDCPINAGGWIWIFLPATCFHFLVLASLYHVSPYPLPNLLSNHYDSRVKRALAFVEPKNKLSVLKYIYINDHHFESFFLTKNNNVCRIWPIKEGSLDLQLILFFVASKKMMLILLIMTNFSHLMETCSKEHIWMYHFYLKFFAILNLTIKFIRVEWRRAVDEVCLLFVLDTLIKIIINFRPMTFILSHFIIIIFQFDSSISFHFISLIVVGNNKHMR